nr:putative ribonuclease H-like domain-containing protein [Tanacetum cinerariifolium]
MSANDKTGLGYDNQLSKNEMPKCEVFKTASNSSVSEIDEDNNQAKNRYKVGIWYHAVPPPYIRNYMPPRADLSFAGLDDSVFKFKISETRTSVNENESIASKSSEETREEPKTVTPEAVVNAAEEKKETVVKTSVGSPKGGKITGKGDLTCLFAKATIDESNLWHRRLGHINFKTLNRLVRSNLVRDHLGKFNGKPDEGFLVRYSVNRKAFRVFNSGTRKVEENLHVNFLEKNLMLQEVDQMALCSDVNAGDQPGDVNTGDQPGDINAGDIQGDVDELSRNDYVSLEDIGIFYGAFNDRDFGAEADTNNLDSSTVISNPGFKDPSWIEAMQEELLQFKLQDKKGIDYDEVFAPVAMIEAIRLFMAYASFKDFIVYQMDVKSVFLYGAIEEEVYVCQPTRFEDPDFPDKVYKVKKALYGLHQAPRAWYETLSTYLLNNRFKRGQIDKTLFIKRNKGDILLVQVYMSSMGELTFFLGLQVKQKQDGIFISQDKYVAEILKKFGFIEVKTASTLMETSKPLLKDEDGQKATAKVKKVNDQEQIQALVDKTKLTRTRLNLQEAKAAQAKEIAALKKKVSKLNKWRKSRSRGLRRLKRFGSDRRVKSPMEKDDDETQGRTNDDEMFRVNDLAGEEVVMDSTADPVTTVKDSAIPTTYVTEDEITLAQALAALKSIKPKVVVQEQKMSTIIPTTATTVTTDLLTLRAKGKAKMIEPKIPLKKKEQMRIDEEYDKKLQVEEQEASRLSKAQQDKEANNSWDNMQAMIDADRLLAERLQVDENVKLVINDYEELRKCIEILPNDGDEVDENVKLVINDYEVLRKCIEILPNDGDEVLIEATPISSRSPTIIDYKIHKDGKKNYFKIIRADDSNPETKKEDEMRFSREKAREN